MTVYRPAPGRPYRYDFWFRGRRYTGPTHQLRKDDADAAEAKVKAQARLEAAGLAHPPPPATPRFQDWAEVYYREQSKRLARADLIQRTLRVVLAFWGATPTKSTPVAGGVYHDLRLGDPIRDPTWLAKFDEWMDARGIAGSTKNSYRSAVSGMYRLALRPRHRVTSAVTTNPMRDVQRDQTNGRVVALPVPVIRQLIAVSPAHVRLALAIAALAPKLRLRSILDLRWDTHFDAEMQFITVTKHKTVRKAGPQVVTITPQLKSILAAAKKSGHAHVITYRGEPVASIKTALRRAVREIGLSYGVKHGGVTFHAIRHSIATLLAELGLPERQRMEVMGHLEIRTTQKYTHLRPTHQLGPHSVLSDAVQVEDLVVAEVEAERTREERRAKARVGQTTGQRHKRLRRSA